MKSSRTLGTITLSSLLVLLIACSAVAEAKKPAPKRKPLPAFDPVKDDPALPRVLLIGDSISIFYTVPTQKALAGKANVHRAPVNCGPTFVGLKNIDAWLGQGRWDLIHFNWGIHDVYDRNGKHQVPIDAYKKNLAKLVRRLKKTGATLIWCSTTPIADGTRHLENSDVVAYNAVAEKIMAAQKIAIDDLYGFALPKLAKIQKPRDCHFTPEGSATLAGQVAASILKGLKK